MPAVNRHKLLSYEALRWLNFTENGTNKGQMVEAFQKAVDGKAQGEPWCMAFVQYCLQRTDDLVRYMDWMTPEMKPHEIFASEHCWTVWLNTPEYARYMSAFPGSIAIWKNAYNNTGHAGIVIKRESEPFSFLTIEGNTSPDQDGSQRDGDGVFMKKRSGNIGKDLHLIGFLNPWPA
jgi:hypothetical protein